MTHFFNPVAERNMDVIRIIFFILSGGVLLYLGGNWLVNGSSSFAIRRNVPKLVVGLTIVAFGTSAPELFISATAALKGSSEIAIGNIIGSNIANIGLILGIAALVFPPRVQSSSIRIQIPFAIAITGLFIYMTTNQLIGRFDALILLVCFAAFILYCAYSSRTKDLNSEISALLSSKLREYLYIILGLAALELGSELFVCGARDFAAMAGVSEFMIGVSLVALGTSLPELATTIVAAAKRESELVVGNVIGSCIFNILLVMGIVGLIRPIPTPDMSIWLDMGVMLGLIVLLLPMLYTGRKLSRPEGSFLLAIYVAYIIYIAMRR
jgi:cation:H+ antiporter